MLCTIKTSSRNSYQNVKCAIPSPRKTSPCASRNVFPCSVVMLRASLSYTINTREFKDLINTVPRKERQWSHFCFFNYSWKAAVTYSVSTDQFLQLQHDPLTSSDWSTPPRRKRRLGRFNCGFKLLICSQRQLGDHFLVRLQSNNKKKDHKKRKTKQGDEDFTKFQLTGFKTSM